MLSDLLAGLTTLNSKCEGRMKITPRDGLISTSTTMTSLTLFEVSSVTIWETIIVPI